MARVLGFAADRLLGDPARWHPVAGFGRLAAALEARAWAPSRARGVAFAVALVGPVAALVAASDRALRGRRGLRLSFRAATLWACLGGRSLDRAARELAAAVDAGELERARRLAPALVGRDPATLDADGLLRAAVESVAENTSDAVVGTLLWGTALGPAGAVAHRVINTLDAMVGHRSARHAAFGWASARADDLLNWPAARLTAGAAAVASPAAAAHPSPNAGLVEAAFAGALGVRLGGPTTYGGRTEERPVLGAGRAPTPADVERACRLALATQLLSLAALLAVARC